MSELAVRQTTTVSLSEKMRYAEAMAGSNLLPKQYQRNPANLLFALEYADALGVAPINAITSIHVIEGKPSASADLIASMVRKAGHRLRVTGDDTYALAQIIRADDPDFTYEARWDMAKARAASLTGKGVWKSYPAAMLRSRAITEVARMGASDALFGVIYTPEELGAEVDADGNMVQARLERPVPSQPVQQVSAADRLRAAVQPADPAPVVESEPVKATAERVDQHPLGERQQAGITKAQLTALNAALSTDIGFTTRDEKLAYLSGELGRDIGSSAELTKAEASLLIDKIKREYAEPAEAELLPEPAEDEGGWPAVAEAGA